jgi:hypothetical protein
LDVALQILELNTRMGLTICPNLTMPEDMNDFGNGEFFNLANKIEFSTQVKHLEMGGSYVVQYTLKSFTGDTASIPEVVIWSSSNPSVATVDANGKVIAIKDGVTTIKGKICDIENTLKVEVGGCNCEENYCYNEPGCCYSGTYKCTGVAIGTSPGTNCPFGSWMGRFTLVGNLDRYQQQGYLEDLYSSEYESYNPITKQCERFYSHGTSNESRIFLCMETAYFLNSVSAGYGLHFDGYLKGNSLTLVSGTTTLHCIRIDK